MRKTIMGALLATAITGSANAAVFVQVYLNQPAASANATLANKPAGTADITFNSNVINFASGSAYTVDEFFNSPTYLTGNGVGVDLNNTYTYITGSTFLNAGANNFVIPHDDGLELNIDGIGVVLSEPGPTSAVNSPFVVNAPTAGLYTFQLSYGETAGPPAVLSFQINDRPVGGLPEATTWGMMIAGFGLVGVAARRRASRVVAA